MAQHQRAESIKWRGKIRIDCDDRRRTYKSLSWAGGVQARVQKEIKILIDFLGQAWNWPSTATKQKNRAIEPECKLHSLWLRFGDKCLVNVGENRYLAFLSCSISPPHREIPIQAIYYSFQLNVEEKVKIGEEKEMGMRDLWLIGNNWSNW